jgi:serine/threonine protein kinase
VADGGFATVYQALDTITGIPVALKIPHPSLITGESLSVFRREVRLTAKLDHPHILPVRDAGVIDGTFYVATPLGKGTLADRLNRRLAGATLVNYMRQMLAALAFAHRKGIMHCDVKPENFILFPENQLRLADFGIARFAQHTVRASAAERWGIWPRSRRWENHHYVRMSSPWAWCCTACSRGNCRNGPSSGRCPAHAG